MKRWKKWLSVTLIIVALIVVVALALSHWIGIDNTGTVHMGTAPSTEKTSLPQPLSVTTSYFSTVLPAGFIVKRQTETPTGDPQLEIEADTPSSTDQKFTVAMGPLPAGGITGLGDYNLRIKQPTNFTPYSLANLPVGGAAFQNSTGSPGFVAFWTHEGKYVEVSLSSGGMSSLDQLQAIYAQALAQWQWK